MMILGLAVSAENWIVVLHLYRHSFNRLHRPAEFTYIRLGLAAESGGSNEPDDV